MSKAVVGNTIKNLDISHRFHAISQHSCCSLRLTAKASVHDGGERVTNSTEVVVPRRATSKCPLTQNLSTPQTDVR